MKVSGGPITDIGVIKDIPDYKLPDGAWSDSTNIKFVEGRIQAYAGNDTAISGTMGTTHYAFTVSYDGNDFVYWIFLEEQTATTAKAYSYDYSSKTDITRAAGGDYTIGVLTDFVGTFIGGLPVFTNWEDAPQCQATPGTAGTALVPLKWDASDTWHSLSYSAKSIREFHSILVAVNIDTNIAFDNKEFYTLRWSHPAEPGAMPETWDETDTTKRAGKKEITGIGQLIDSYTLGNTHIIYGDRGMHGMQLIGGNSVFRFFPINLAHGIMSTNCVQNVKGGHVMLTYDRDLIFHDGRRAESVLKSKWKKHIYDNMNASRQGACHLAKNDHLSELWLFYPTSAGSPDKALVWNYEYNTFSELDVPDVKYGAYGIIDTTDKKVRKLGLCSSSVAFLETDNAPATPPTILLERTGITLGDSEKFKHVNGVWVKGSVTSGQMKVQVGGAMTVDGTYTWGTAVAFDPSSGAATDRYVSITGVNYPFLGIRFTGGTGATDWDLWEFDWDVEMAGKR